MSLGRHVGYCSLHRKYSATAKLPVINGARFNCVQRRRNTDQSNHACTRVRQMYVQHGSELCTFVLASISENTRWCALGSRKHYERHVVEQFHVV